MASEPLRGRGILVTRPGERAAGLARRIEAAGGRAIVFPAIEIEDLPPPAALAELARFDLAVFVSPTAVAKVMAHIQTWPRGLRAATVGGGTRRELEQRGVTNVVSPAHGADSESLLAMPELSDIDGKRVVVFRGEGGRELLGETLRARGARVEYAACYRRTPPKARPTWAEREVHAVTVSSSQSLANLRDALGIAFLRGRPLFVPHPRVADAARALSLDEVVLAGPSDDQMVDALVAYFRHD